MIGTHSFRFFLNPRVGGASVEVLPLAGFRAAAEDIRSWPGYAPTPLHDLAVLATGARVGSVGLKDEAGRFGLGSFKALGGAYAVARVLRAELARLGIAAAATTADLEARRYVGTTAHLTVTCATDGNHGRSVAWGAQRFGCRCVIVVHETVSEGRVEAIARYGAEVRRVAGNYDDAVRAAARQAELAGWRVISDTSWPGYQDVPRDVMQGYRLMADEAADAWAGAPPTHVFIQGGVGGCAAAVSVQMRARYAPAPRLVVVEPENAACLLASAERGALTCVDGGLETIMAGLACGEPSPLAWPELDQAATAFMAIPDAAAADTMRLLARHGVVAGESGVAGLAGFLLASADPAARAALGLDAASRVLAFSTEGATDPALYQRLIG